MQNKCRKSLLSSLESFFCRNLKNVRTSFLGQYDVETVSPPGFLLKSSWVWGGLFQKLFKGYIFCFLVYSDGPYILELSAPETNLMKNCSVSTGGSFCLFTFASKRSLSNICQSLEGALLTPSLAQVYFCKVSFMGFLWAATKLPTNCWPITVKCNWR